MELKTDLINAPLHLFMGVYHDGVTYIHLECPQNNLFNQEFKIDPGQVEAIQAGLQEPEHLVTRIRLARDDGKWFTAQIIPKEPLILCFGRLGENLDLRLTGSKQEAIKLVDHVVRELTIKELV